MTLIPRIVMLMLIGLGLSACAYTPQTAVISPEVNLVESNEGHGASVVVKVVDERSDKVLGHRGSATFKGAEITTNQDIESLIREEILRGLAKKGFNPIKCSSDSKPNLKVEIRLIEYSTSTGFWTGGIHTKAALKAIANVNGKTYENIYRVDNEKRVVVVPTASANQKYLNELVTDILSKLFQDDELISTLAHL